LISQYYWKFSTFSLRRFWLFC